MDLGIDNLFVIANFYGEKDVFANAEIEDINWLMRGSRLELSLLIHEKPLNAPKKWGTFDSVYVRIVFYEVENVSIDILNDKLRINEYIVKRIDNKYLCKMSIDNEQKLILKFETAQIQNVKPYLAY